MSITSSTHPFATVFVAYLLINLGLEFGETLVSPLAASMGATPVLIGMVATGFTYGSMLFRLVSGPAIDSFNRKHLLAAAVAIIGASFVGSAFATSVPMLLAFRILQGVGQAFTAPICLTLAADVTARERIASGIGTLAVARGLAGMIGPLTALKICEATDYRTAFIIAAIVEAVCLFTALRLPVRGPRTRKPLRISFSGCIAKEALPPAMMQFLFMMAWSCVYAFLVVYGHEQGLGSNVGLFNTVYGMAVFVAAPLGGRLTDRYGHLMLIPMLVLMSGSLWLISFSDDIGTLIAAAIVGAFGYGAAGPVARSMAMSVVPEERRGAASSTLFVMSDIGQLVGPIVGGLLVSAFGYAVMFRIAPIWLALAVILLLSTRHYVRRQAARWADSGEAAE